jgi:hypothetical protein
VDEYLHGKSEKLIRKMHSPFLTTPESTATIQHDKSQIKHL